MQIARYHHLGRTAPQAQGRCISRTACSALGHARNNTQFARLPHALGREVALGPKGHRHFGSSTSRCKLPAAALKPDIAAKQARLRRCNIETAFAEGHRSP